MHLLIVNYNYHPHRSFPIYHFVQLWRYRTRSASTIFVGDITFICKSHCCNNYHYKFINRFDFDHSSFSPPSHDDSFFYIRYPKSSEEQNNNPGSSGQGGYRPISQVLNEKANTSSGIVNKVIASSATGSNVSEIKGVPNIDFSKHPGPCQPFVPASGNINVCCSIDFHWVYFYLMKSHFRKELSKSSAE